MLFLVILGFDKIKYPEWIKNGIIRVVELSWVLLGIVYKEIALKGVYKIYNSVDKFSIFGSDAAHFSTEDSDLEYLHRIWLE